MYQSQFFLHIQAMHVRPWLVEDAVLCNAHVMRTQYLMHVCLHPHRAFLEACLDYTILLVGRRESEKYLHRHESTWAQLMLGTHDVYVLGFMICGFARELWGTARVWVDWAEVVHAGRNWHLTELMFCKLALVTGLPVAPTQWCIDQNESFWCYNAHLLSNITRAACVHAHIRDVNLRAFASFDAEYQKYRAHGGIVVDYGHFRDALRRAMQLRIHEHGDLHELSAVMHILHHDGIDKKHT